MYCDWDNVPLKKRSNITEGATAVIAIRAAPLSYTGQKVCLYSDNMTVILMLAGIKDFMKTHENRFPAEPSQVRFKNSEEDKELKRFKNSDDNFILLHFMLIVIQAHESRQMELMFKHIPGKKNQAHFLSHIHTREEIENYERNNMPNQVSTKKIWFPGLLGKDIKVAMLMILLYFCFLVTLVRCH